MVRLTTEWNVEKGIAVLLPDYPPDGRMTQIMDVYEVRMKKPSDQTRLLRVTYCKSKAQDQYNRTAGNK